jgi:hypothetical protein
VKVGAEVVGSEAEGLGAICPRQAKRRVKRSRIVWVYFIFLL